MMVRVPSGQNVFLYRMCRIAGLICLFFVVLFSLEAKEGPNPIVQGETIAARVEKGDTLLIIELEPVDVVAPREFRNRFEAWRYNRLVRNVKAAYPYARLAGEMFEEYGAYIMSLESDRERRRFTRKMEKELREELEDDLRRLTVSQGLILIKLIDRETRLTTYDILKDYRGTFSAIFWQSLSRLFGLSLRTEYDPYGEDRLIEEIVQMIEDGHL